MPRRLNPVAVAAYLCYAYLPGRETLLDGIFELLPGELLRYADGKVSRSPYWRLPSTREPSGPDGEDLEIASRALRGRLERAVARRLPPGEPVGAFLSGGLDSSLVVALARRLHDGPVRTYSVSFGAGYANELPFSSLVAAHCGTDHHIVELAPAAVLHHLDETIGLLDEPIGDPLTVPNALLFREAAAEVGVVLNGEGGDPCFGGPKNLPMVLAELFGDGANDGQHRRRRCRVDGAPARAQLPPRPRKCYDDLPAMLAPDVRAALQDAPLERALTPHLDRRALARLRGEADGDERHLQRRAPHPAEGGRAERAVRRRAALAAVRPGRRRAGR